MKPDDLILEWLDMPYNAGGGFHTIQYGNNVYIVLETRMGCRPKYIGWFCVSETEIDNNQYKFCCHKEGLYLYRAKSDDLPEI